MRNITKPVYSICRVICEPIETDIGLRGTGNAEPLRMQRGPRRSIRSRCATEHAPLIFPLWPRFIGERERLLRERAGSTPATIPIIAISCPHNFYSLRWYRRRLWIGIGRWLFTSLPI